MYSTQPPPMHGTSALITTTPILTSDYAYNTAAQCNRMLCHALGWAVTFSLQHFIAPALDLLPCLQTQGTRNCNMGSKLIFYF